VCRGPVGGDASPSSPPLDPPLAIFYPTLVHCPIVHYLQSIHRLVMHVLLFFRNVVYNVSLETLTEINVSEIKFHKLYSAHRGLLVFLLYRPTSEILTFYCILCLHHIVVRTFIAKIKCVKVR